MATQCHRPTTTHTHSKQRDISMNIHFCGWKSRHFIYNSARTIPLTNANGRASTSLLPLPTSSEKKGKYHTEREREREKCIIHFPGSIVRENNIDAYSIQLKFFSEIFVPFFVFNSSENVSESARACASKSTKPNDSLFLVAACRA